MCNAMLGFDPKDSTSVERASEDYTRELATPVKGMKIGIPKEFFGHGLKPDVEQAVRAALAEYERRGATVVEISMPMAERSSNVSPCTVTIGLCDS